MTTVLQNAAFYVGDCLRGMATSVELRWAVGFLVILLLVDIVAKGWRVSWSRKAIDSVFASVGMFHINLLFVPLVYVASAKVKSLYAAIGLPAVPGDFWSDVPVWLMVPFAVLAYDFADYWNHRLMHMKWLWPVHAIHHSDPHVNGATAYRVHALELLVMWVSYTLLLSWLGLPDGVIGAGAILLTLHVIYVHIDKDWGHGPFRLWLASPRFHRWHHADLPAAYGKNLANVFPFYDWMFGTYRVPGPCTAVMGMRDIPQNDVLKLTAWPFLEWARMLRESAARLFARVAAFH